MTWAIRSEEPLTNTKYGLTESHKKEPIKGLPENSRQMNRMFRVDFLDDSISNMYQSTNKISNFMWVCIRMLWNENFGTLHYTNSTFVFFENQKLSKISFMNWAQQILIDYV